jgi:tetratricopeptide (TPR) repeat protein
MPRKGIWSRVRTGRLVQVMLVYLGVSWLIVQVVSDLRGMLDLPAWIGPVTLILLAVGLLIIVATAWVQSHPLVDAREAADEVPSSWELDLGDAVGALRRGRLPHLTWGRALLGGAVAFSLLVGVVGAWVLFRGDGSVFGTREAAAESAPDGIAVLPFTVRGAAVEEWREGMVDLLSTGLDGAGGLRAIASRTVLARWHEIVGTGEADQAVALDVARRVGARYALLGQAVAIGPSVRLTVDVYDLSAQESRPLGQRQVEGDPDSVLVLVDRLSVQTLGLVLQQTGLDLPQVDMASLTTGSLPALKAYLDGEARFRQGDFEAAASAYERAVAVDTLFALAYWRLSQALGWNETAQSPRVEEANARAVELADRMPPRGAFLARAALESRRGRLRSVALLREAVQRYPDDAEAWYQLGEAYYHLRSSLVGWEEVEKAFRRAVALEPRMAQYRIHLLDGALRFHGDSAMTYRELEELERAAPNSQHTRRYRLAAAIAFGGPAARDSAVETVLASTNQQLGGQINAALSHPRFADVRRDFGRAAYSRAPGEIRREIARTTGWDHFFARGQVRAAIAAFGDPNVPPHEQPEAILSIHLSGLPVPAEELARAEQQADPRRSTFVVAAYSTSAGKWDAHAAGVTRLRTRADSLQEAGDSLGARRVRATSRLLEAYGVLHRGKSAEATALMEGVHADLPPQYSEWARWWLGRLHIDQGRWNEAEPYFLSFLKYEKDPLAAYYLGQVYEATRREVLAPPLYAFFVEHWANADPELQPLVDDARRRLQRLSAERRD